MKRAILVAAIATAIGSLMACGSDSPAEPTGPPANIAGSYNLTLTAAWTCSGKLPAATRVLKYVADITQTGTLNTLFIMTLSGNVAFGEVVISGGIAGQQIKFGTFGFTDKTTGGGIALVAPSTGLSGTGSVASDGSITGTVKGTFQTPSGVTCSSSAHQIELVKK